MGVYKVLPTPLKVKFTYVTPPPCRPLESGALKAWTWTRRGSLPQQTSGWKRPGRPPCADTDGILIRALLTASILRHASRASSAREVGAAMD